MLAKRKSGKVIPPQAALQNLKYTVYKISMPDYEQHHYDKDKLTEAGKGHFCPWILNRNSSRSFLYVFPFITGWGHLSF